jgi:hypothetical protein
VISDTIALSEKPATGPSPAHDASGFAAARASTGFRFRATPAAAMARRDFRATFRKLAMADLGEQPESAQKPLRDGVPGSTAKIDEICK